MNLEKQLLICCLQNPKMLELLVLKRVTKEYFANFDTQKLFDIVQWVYKKYKCLLTEPILKQVLDRSSVKSPEDQKRLLLLFHELTIATAPTTPIEFVLDQFLDKYAQDKLEDTLKSAAMLVRDKDTTKALEVLRSGVAKVTTAFSDEKLEEGYIGEDTGSRLQTYSDKKNNPGVFGGLSTGFSRFDKETNGLQKGQVVVVMGAPKSAKSIFLINVARNVVKQGKRVLFIVNEGGRELVLRRYTALDAGVNYTNLRDGRLAPEEEDRFRQSLEASKNSKLLYICSIPPVLCTTSLISSKMEELEVDGKFDLVVIDYMGLMDSDNPSTRKEEDWKKLGSITLELKSFAMIKKIPILTVFHVNRSGAKSKGNSYSPSDISRSWEILKTVDMLISWKAMNQDELDLVHSGDIAMKLAASRDSAPALIELFADLNLMKVEEKPDGFSTLAQDPS